MPETSKQFSVFSWKRQRKFRLGCRWGERSMRTDQRMRTLSHSVSAAVTMHKNKHSASALILNNNNHYTSAENLITRLHC